MIIEDEVVVGTNAVILEGVRVGKGSVVAAGVVVVEDVPENSVVAGTPARVIKKINDMVIWRCNCNNGRICRGRMEYRKGRQNRRTST